MTTTTLTNIKALIIDMDGVLWHGNQPLPGLIDFFQLLRERQFRFILATNNASQTADQYVKKLAEMGVSVNHNEILTSGMATAHYLSVKADPALKRVFVIGGEGTRQPLIEEGFTLTDLYQVGRNKQDLSPQGADYVVCGLDKDLSWNKLATATLNIRAGARFIGTNADTTLPTELGLTIGNGAILAALTTATGISPTIIGKPEPIMYKQAMKMLGTNPDQTIAIGDRLGTDILGAVRTGIRSLMVLTGVSNEEELSTLDYAPTWIMQDIRAITLALK